MRIGVRPLVGRWPDRDKTTTRLGLVAIAVSTLAVSARAVAAPDAAQGPARASQDTRAPRAVVLEILRARKTPESAADFRSVGAQADDALVEIAGDAQVDLAVRARAMAALAWFPSARVRGFLDATLAGAARGPAPTPALLVRRAAVAQGWVGGPAAPERLGGLFDHGDPDVRVDAAIAFGLLRLPAGLKILRGRLPQESDARVRAQMERQIRVLEAALAPAAAR